MNLDRRLWKPASAVPAPLAANMLSDVLLHGFQVAVLGSGNSSERRTTQHDYRGGSYVLRRLNANPADATSRQHVVAHNACNQLDSRVMSHHSSSGPPPTSAASSQEAAELVAEVEKWDLERRWRLVSRRMVQPMIEHLICRNWAPKPQAVLDTTLTPIFSISSTIQGVPLSWFVEHVAPHMPVVHLERVACRIVLPALVALLTYLHTVASVRHTAIHIRHLFLLCGGSNATPSQRGGAEEAAAAISAPSSRLVAAALFHDADSIPRRLCDVSRADDPPPPHENPSATAWLSREALQASLEATYPAPSSPPRAAGGGGGGASADGETWCGGRGGSSSFFFSWGSLSRAPTAATSTTTSSSHGTLEPPRRAPTPPPRCPLQEGNTTILLSSLHHLAKDLPTARTAGSARGGMLRLRTDEWRAVVAVMKQLLLLPLVDGERSRNRIVDLSYEVENFLDQAERWIAEAGGEGDEGGESSCGNRNLNRAMEHLIIYGPLVIPPYEDVVVAAAEYPPPTASADASRSAAMGATPEGGGTPPESNSGVEGEGDDGGDERSDKGEGRAGDGGDHHDDAYDDEPHEEEGEATAAAADRHISTTKLTTPPRKGSTTRGEASEDEQKASDMLKCPSMPVPPPCPCCSPVNELDYHTCAWLRYCTCGHQHLKESQRHKESCPMRSCLCSVGHLRATGGTHQQRCPFGAPAFAQRLARSMLSNGSGALQPWAAFDAEGRTPIGNAFESGIIRRLQQLSSARRSTAAERSVVDDVFVPSSAIVACCCRYARANSHTCCLLPHCTCGHTALNNNKRHHASCPVHTCICGARYLQIAASHLDACPLAVATGGATLPHS